MITIDARAPRETMRLRNGCSMSGPVGVCEWMCVYANIWRVDVRSCVCVCCHALKVVFRIRYFRYVFKGTDIQFNTGKYGIF